MRRVSYVITVYNKAAFLAHVVAGLRAQEGAFEREFIFIDDGSTDDSVARLEALTAGLERVRIVSQPNRGPACATNAGFALATGDIVKPVDGDDVLAPDATRLLIGAIDGLGVEWSTFDVGAVLEYDAEAPPAAALAQFAREELAPEILKDFLWQCLKNARTTPTSWMAKTEAVLDVGGCDERVFVQDYSIELRLAARSAPALVPGSNFAFPRQMEGRLTGAQAQTLHDLNLAIAYFLADGPPLPRGAAQYAIKRLAMRTWSWAHRRAGYSPFSAPFARRTAAMLGLTPATAAEAFKSCAPFRAHAKLRLAPAGARARLERATSAQPAS